MVPRSMSSFIVWNLDLISSIGLASETSADNPTAFITYCIDQLIFWSLVLLNLYLKLQLIN